MTSPEKIACEVTTSSGTWMMSEDAGTLQVTDQEYAGRWDGPREVDTRNVETNLKDRERKSDNG